jgi:hypothetical protein
MAIFINGKPFTPPIHPKKKKSGHTKARPYPGSLDEPGRFRVANWMYILNRSHSAVYARLNPHHRHPLPPPDGHDPNPFWHISTVRTHCKG